MFVSLQTTELLTEKVELQRDVESFGNFLTIAL